MLKLFFKSKKKKKIGKMENTYFDSVKICISQIIIRKYICKSHIDSRQSSRNVIFTYTFVIFHT